MFCARCNRPLKGSEAKPLDKMSASGAGATIYVCRDTGQCKPVPTQTNQVSLRH